MIVKDDRHVGKWAIILDGYHIRNLSKKQAVLKEKEILIQQSYEERLHTLEIENIYLLDIFRGYLDHYKFDVAESTYLKAEQVYRDVISSRIGIILFKDVDEQYCLDFHKFVSSLEYSTRHKNYILSLFCRAIKFGVQKYAISRNPCSIISRFKMTFTDKARINAIKKNIWSVEDFEKYIFYIPEGKYRMFLSCLFYTGMRQGEAQALTWNDFVVQGDTAYLDVYKSYSTKTKTGVYVIKEPKTETSVRKVFLNQKFTSALLEYKKQCMKNALFNDDWFIFNNSKPLPRNNIDKKHKEAIKKSGVKNIRLHDLRHSHASILINNGENIAVVSQRLGHANTRITLQVYTHLMVNEDRKLAGRLDFIF